MRVHGGKGREREKTQFNRAHLRQSREVSVLGVTLTVLAPFHFFLTFTFSLYDIRA